MIVNAGNFYSFLQHYNSLQQSEADELIAIQKEFPYSQVVNNFLARVAQDLKFPDKEFYLHKAAVYSTDRAVLKAIMTAARVERLSVNEVAVLDPKIEVTTEVVIEAKTVADATKVVPISAVKAVENNPVLPIEELYLEVAHDLAQLAESKLRFEEIVAALERNAAPLPVQLKTIKLDSVVTSEELEVGLIDEIKKSKKQVKPEGPKQKEQIEIIDQFIKTQPTISKPKPTSEPPDLTEKTDGFTGNIVSETLVEILLKQGKTEKAIEMLKKLIWKFPQKKAYFAAQIEGLKK